MRPLFILMSTLSIIFSMSLASAQMSCEYALLGDAQSSRSALTKEVIANEFNLVINDANVALVDRLVNKGIEPTAAERASFKQLLGDLWLADKKLRRQVEYAIDHKVTNEQATALKLALAIGRNEIGRDYRLMGHFDNYTDVQIVRKDRVLELAGFSFEERARISSNRFLEDVLTKYAAENLVYDNVIKDPKVAVAMNEKVIAEMNVLAKQKTAKGRRLDALDAVQIDKIYEMLSRHPLAKFLNGQRFDPQGSIGFCFGRAMTAHIEAMQMNLDQNSVRKVFVVGKMRAIGSDITWQFHVATTVKNTQGGWTVIDPFVGKPTSLEAWYDYMYKQDIHGTLRLYVTDATRLGATTSGRYNKAHLMSEFYNGYFEKVLEYYQLKSKGQLSEESILNQVIDSTLPVLHTGS